MAYNFIKNIILNESILDNELELIKLPYARGDLDPCISEDTINYHYSKLAKAYVDRFNNGEGDLNFNEAGAVLHNTLFVQYQIPNSLNRPTGNSDTFINTHFKSFDQFKDEFAEIAMGIQGSGWIYLARNGQIKTIKNHQLRSDIILLIDWWEHAWVFDYQADKKKYLDAQWKIINWNIINARLGLQS